MPRNASRPSLTAGLNACDERRFRNIVAAAVNTCANGDAKAAEVVVFLVGDKAIIARGILNPVSLVAVEMSRMPRCQIDVNACAPSGESLLAVP